MPPPPPPPPPPQVAQAGETAKRVIKIVAEARAKKVVFDVLIVFILPKELDGSIVRSPRELSLAASYQ
jgi:orotate phosphoribosyltransferase-like protein